jgi:hypothetical protein
MKLVKPKLFLRTFWWLILFYGLTLAIFTDGLIGLKQGFDWSFIYEPTTYFKLSFNMVWWTIINYFVFWRLNPVFRDKMARKFEKSN